MFCTTFILVSVVNIDIYGYLFTKPKVLFIIDRSHGVAFIARVLH
jgi:hypothetical protein